MPTVKLLPPAPDDEALHFDKHAHQHRTHAVVVTNKAPERARILAEEELSDFATPGISFQDLGKMSTFTRGRRSPRKNYATPVWVNSNELVQSVVCRYLEKRLYLPCGEGMPYKERIAKIQAAAEWRSKETEYLLDSMLNSKEPVPTRQIQNVDSQIVVARRGLAALVCAVVYFKYRLHYTSVQISAETGIRPPCVRIILWRLCRTYREWQAGKPYKKYSGVPRSYYVRKGRQRPLHLEALWELRFVFGLSWHRVGKVCGMNGSGTSRARGRYNRWFPTVRDFRTATTEYQKWSATRIARLSALRKRGKTWKEIGVAMNMSTMNAYCAALRHAPQLCNVRWSKLAKRR